MRSSDLLDSVDEDLGRSRAEGERMRVPKHDVGIVIPANEAKSMAESGSCSRARDDRRESEMLGQAKVVRLPAENGQRSLNKTAATFLAC